MAYDPTIKEEELKNKVAADLFPGFDCTRILGNVDFCVQPKVKGPTLWETESLLWAEAKAGIRTDFAPLFAQLVLTVGGEKTFERHSPPPFLGAFDSEKIAFLPWHVVLDLFFRSDVDWTATPSDTESPSFRHVLGLLRPVLDGNLVLFRFGDPDLAKFAKKNLFAGNDRTNRLPVTRNNFPFVYQKWVKAVKPSIAVDWALAKAQGIHDADFFLADLLSKDNATLMQNLFVVLRGNHYLADRQLDPSGFLSEKRVDFKDGQKAHAQFWNQYRRPPRKVFWAFINDRRDLLMPPDIREREGSFFTPQIWVEKAQETLAAVLGEDWQDDHYVWDCAAGTGNLLAGLDPKAKYRVWASTLQQGDVSILHERIDNGAALLHAHVFQFDFLNDSFDKLPQGLRDVVDDPEKRKKLVVFINPPFAEAGDTKQWTGTGENKTDVAVATKTYAKYLPAIGLAGRELFAQFLIRIYREIPGCLIGQFSKPKHLQSPNFEAFRQSFRPKLERAFLVRGNTFDNVKGKFPIGFFVWDTSKTESFKTINATVYANDGMVEGTKTILCYDNLQGNIGKWLSSFKDNESEPIGFMSNGRNDFQNQKLVYIINRKDQMPTPRGWHITRRNLVQMCIFLAVRHCIDADWLNDRDQFLWPADSWKDDTAFQLDCLAFALFHGQNRISCKAGANHWIPFTEDEVGATDAFQSHFMSDFLKRVLAGEAGIDSAAGGAPTLPGFGSASCDPLPKTTSRTSRTSRETFSAEARAVFDAGRELWRHYHAQPGALPDASFYDIRAHFQGFKPNGHMHPDSGDATYTALVGALRAAERALAAKLAPKVYEHGFLQGAPAASAASEPYPDADPPPLLAAED